MRDTLDWSEPLTIWEREARLIYSVIVAGKSADFADVAVRRLIDGDVAATPFEQIRSTISVGDLDKRLRFARVGNYAKIEKCLRELVVAGVDLLTCTPDDLEKIHGIGRKTSRFFILWTRPEEKHAALDVHILRWMRSLGYDAPKATPSNQKKYAELEKAFLAEADKRGMSARDLDYKIWSEGAGRGENIAPERKS